ncbi:MAG: hypothetical protein IAG13_09035, partial [Deltaproteobacteria bacterium]|nr:hypothetical protein [Nannocystaceae bacterium]
RAQHQIAAHAWDDAERTLSAAYFTAIADGQLADAAASAELLALVSTRTGTPKLAEQWRGHAEAARARMQSH